MKKFIMGICVMLCSLSIGFAGIAPPASCIAIYNMSTDPVQFVTPKNLGWIPVVQPSAKYTLNNEFMPGCGTTSCEVKIVPQRGDTTVTLIRSVPKGSLILYSSPNLYYIDQDAHVVCR